MNISKVYIFTLSLIVFEVIPLLQPISAQSASKWSKIGQEAEIREEYDAAYEAYRHAHELKPEDIRYKAFFERMRLQAAIAHVSRGRVLRQSGDLQEALIEFGRAIVIDGSNQAAMQEIEATQRAISSASSTQSKAMDLVTRPSSDSAGPTTLQPISVEPITLHTTEDTKSIYQAIGKLAGINVIFDSNYTSKRISVDLDGITLYKALRILEKLSGTFWAPVALNTIFVAENTRVRRADVEPLAVQTFYLSNVSQPADATEVLAALRNIFDQTKIFLVPSQNAIVIRATPDQLTLTQDLLNNLDRAKPEVVIDVAVLEVDRNRERDLGITLPQHFSITPQASNASSSNTSSTTTSNANLTLNNLAHINGSNFAVAIDTAKAEALLSDTDTRILQNPSVRATDGQKATLKIGQRVPIATGSYNPGVGGTIGGIGVQTQFQYVDVGVNIDMTPTVHLDREISLKLRIEISTQQPSTNVGGVDQPVFGQEVVEHVVQLKEGEPSILAGLLNQTDSKSTSGTPGLSEIPLLKYLFRATEKKVSKQEIVFLLIPHIVREPLLTRMNIRAIDTGTAQGIELSRADAAEDEAADSRIKKLSENTASNTTPVTAASAATAVIGQMRQTSPSATTIDALISTSNRATPPPVTFTVVPPVIAQSKGASFQVAITSSNVQDLYSAPLKLHFDSRALSLVNVDAGDLWGRDGKSVAVVDRDEGNGVVSISLSRPPGVRGIDGQGKIYVLTFKANAPGDSTITLTEVGAKNSTQANLPVVGSSAVVHVN